MERKRHPHLWIQHPLGPGDGCSLDQSGVGKSHKIKEFSGFITFRFRSECPGTFPGRVLHSVPTLWIMCYGLVEDLRNESGGTLGCLMGYDTLSAMTAASHASVTEPVLPHRKG